MAKTRSIAILFLILICIPASAEQKLFHFRNGFWINLHHYLYAEALADAQGVSPRFASSARTALQHVPCVALSDGDKAVWSLAVAFYSANYIKPDWLFDQNMRDLQDVLGNAENQPDVPGGLPAELKAVLEKVAPVYRKACWPSHQRANAHWIAALQPRLERHGDAIAERLETVYETTWPSIAVDVVTYSNWAGAYTFDQHITVDSVNPDYQDDAALEVVFHESSHALGDHLLGQLRTAFSNNHAEMSPDLYHALIFFTAGSLAKTELRTEDPDYVPIGYKIGIYKRVPRWAGYAADFERYWIPYLEGKTTREAALNDVAHAICCSAETGK